MNEDEWYEHHYSSISATAKQNSFANELMHKLIEIPFKTNRGKDILEVGANIGEHLDFVKSDFKSYTLTDFRKNAITAEQLTKIKNRLIEKNIEHSPTTPIEEGGVKVRFLSADVEKLPFEPESFDRVISTCLFHHLINPLKGFEELRRVARGGQTISILIPNDPGMLYRFSRAVTSLRNARKKGLLGEARYVHAMAHRNNFLHLTVLLRHVFSEDKIVQRNYPFIFKSYDLNIFTVFHITKKI